MAPEFDDDGGVRGNFLGSDEKRDLGIFRTLSLDETHRTRPPCTFSLEQPPPTGLKAASSHPLAGLPDLHNKISSPSRQAAPATPISKTYSSPREFGKCSMQGRTPPIFRSATFPFKPARVLRSIQSDPSESHLTKGSYRDQIMNVNTNLRQMECLIGSNKNLRSIISDFKTINVDGDSSSELDATPTNKQLLSIHGSDLKSTYTSHMPIFRPRHSVDSSIHGGSTSISIQNNDTSRGQTAVSSPTCRISEQTSEQLSSDRCNVQLDLLPKPPAWFRSAFHDFSNDRISERPDGPKKIKPGPTTCDDIRDDEGYRIETSNNTFSSSTPDSIGSESQGAFDDFSDLGFETCLDGNVTFSRQMHSDKSNNCASLPASHDRSSSEEGELCNSTVEDTQQLPENSMNNAVDNIRKTAVAVTGTTLVAAGTVLIPVPIIPGYVIVYGGLLVLASEFEGAKKALDVVKLPLEKLLADEEEGGLELLDNSYLQGSVDSENVLLWEDLIELPLELGYTLRKDINEEFKELMQFSYRNIYILSDSNGESGNEEKDSCTTIPGDEDFQKIDQEKFQQGKLRSGNNGKKQWIRKLLLLE